MSLKHVEKYYADICGQYNEMIENIKDLEKEAAEGIIEPERVERLKDQVAPIKQNYERWTYMMFLLHQPQRKEKQPRYKRQQQKLLKTISPKNTIEGVYAENEEAFTHIGE